MLPMSAGEPDDVPGPGCESGRVLEAQARTLHLEFDYSGSMMAYDRAYAAYRREGDLLGAARAARTLGWFHGSVYDEFFSTARSSSIGVRRRCQICSRPAWNRSTRP